MKTKGVYTWVYFLYIENEYIHGSIWLLQWEVIGSYLQQIKPNQILDPWDSLIGISNFYKDWFPNIKREYWEIFLQK